MTTEADARILRYLQDLEGELGDLPAYRRQELLDEVGEHIAARAALDPETEAGVRTVLERLGDPVDHQRQGSSAPFGTLGGLSWVLAGLGTLSISAQGPTAVGSGPLGPTETSLLEVVVFVVPSSCRSPPPSTWDSGCEPRPHPASGALTNAVVRVGLLDRRPTRGLHDSQLCLRRHARRMPGKMVGDSSERGGAVAAELTNWAGNLAYRAASVRYPTSVVEVQELVARLPRVRALGTRHSFNAIADSPGGALISLSALGPEVTVDAEAMTVSVTGGTRYGILAAELQSEGYALHNTGSLPHISVAGATATGTHGSGDRNGILSTAVSAVDLVQADGSLVTVDRSNPDLRALAVGLGAFGVITRVVLDIQPTYLVRQDVYRNAPWDSVLEAFDEVMASAYSVSLIGDFGSPVIRQLWQKTRVESVGDGQQQPTPVPDTLHGGTWYDDAEEPPDHALTVRAGIPGPWSERLPHFRLDAPPSAGGDELQTEYFVERRHAVDALRTLRRLGDRISPHLHATEVRTAAADDLWLSPAYERDSLCIGFTWRKHPTEVMALLPDLEAELTPYDPRPHWGKLFACNDDDLARRFPRLPDFLELRTTYDPTDKFSNTFIDWRPGHARSP